MFPPPLRPTPKWHINCGCNSIYQLFTHGSRAAKIVRAWVYSPLSNRSLFYMHCLSNMAQIERAARQQTRTIKPHHLLRAAPPLISRAKHLAIWCGLGLGNPPLAMCVLRFARHAATWRKVSGVPYHRSMHPRYRLLWPKFSYIYIDYSIAQGTTRRAANAALSVWLIESSILIDGWRESD